MADKSTVWSLVNTCHTWSILEMSHTQYKPLHKRPAYFTSLTLWGGVEERPYPPRMIRGSGGATSPYPAGSGGRLPLENGFGEFWLWTMASDASIQLSFGKVRNRSAVQSQKHDLQSTASVCLACLQSIVQWTSQSWIPRLFQGSIFGKNSP